MKLNRRTVITGAGISLAAPAPLGVNLAQEGDDRYHHIDNEPARGQDDHSKNHHLLAVFARRFRQELAAEPAKIGIFHSS